jgi:hypothetical protein
MRHGGTAIPVADDNFTNVYDTTNGSTATFRVYARNSSAGHAVRIDVTINPSQEEEGNNCDVFGLVIPSHPELPQGRGRSTSRRHSSEPLAGADSQHPRSLPLGSNSSHRAGMIASDANEPSRRRGPRYRSGLKGERPLASSRWDEGSGARPVTSHRCCRCARLRCVSSMYFRGLPRVPAGTGCPHPHAQSWGCGAGAVCRCRWVASSASGS